MDPEDDAQGLVGQFYELVLQDCFAAQPWPFSLVRAPLTQEIPSSQRAAWQELGALYDADGNLDFNPLRFGNLFELPPRAASVVFDYTRGGRFSGEQALPAPGELQNPAQQPERIGYGVIAVHDNPAVERDAPSVPFEEIRDVYLNTDATRPMVTYQRAVAEERWPGTFVSYVQYMLAAPLALAITKDHQRKASFLADADAALEKAIDDMASTGPPDRIFGRNPLSQAAWGNWSRFGSGGYGGE